MKEGDENSRKRTNSIIYLVADGVNIEGVEPGRHSIFQHFHKHFKRSTQPRPDIRDLVFKSLSVTNGADLIKPFLLEEIKAAVWDCDSFKCPGQMELIWVSSNTFGRF